ncbi:MAG TPA: polysaccharide deacetylase family protein [Candidatus Acidoferrales bacterium]|nr:polysaccharide deacetylase family protein [Candidatus Acidoferrales bacterium]
MTATRVLAQSLARSGLPALARRVRRLRRQPGRAFVLMYHRVADTQGYVVDCVPLAAFDAQLSLLRTRAQVVPLRRLVERLQKPEPLAEDLAAITFDDGYRDNLDVALPILEQHGLPATVFVTTRFVDGSLRPLDERLFGAFETLWQHRTPPSGAASVRANGTGRLVETALANPGSLATVRKLRAQLKREPPEATERLIRDLEELAGDSGPRRSMLDWDAVRALTECGVEIGSHTVSHAIVSALSPEAAARELRESKEHIEREIGQPVLGFAFPNGHRGDFAAEHVAMLKQAGYAYACTAEWGANRPGGDPYRLRRIGVGADSRALLDLKLAIADGAAHPCAA